MNALLLAPLLLRAGLVPRIIPIVGLIGAPLLLAGSVGILFGVIDQVSAAGFLAAVLIAGWEIALGFWLLLKGSTPRPWIGSMPRRGRSNSSMHTEHVKAANPAYERLLQDYVDYHLALVVVGGFFTLALLAFGVGSWVRFRRAPRASSDAPTSVRRRQFHRGAAAGRRCGGQPEQRPQPTAGLAGAIGTPATSSRPRRVSSHNR